MGRGEYFIASLVLSVISNLLIIGAIYAVWRWALSEMGVMTGLESIQDKLQTAYCYNAEEGTGGMYHLQPDLAIRGKYADNTIYSSGLLG